MSSENKFRMYAKCPHCGSENNEVYLIGCGVDENEDDCRDGGIQIEVSEYSKLKTCSSCNGVFYVECNELYTPGLRMTRLIPDPNGGEITPDPEGGEPRKESES